VGFELGDMFFYKDKSANSLSRKIFIVTLVSTTLLSKVKVIFRFDFIKKNGPRVIQVKFGAVRIEGCVYSAPAPKCICFGVIDLVLTV
jgi:hypothetical protein